MAGNDRKAAVTFPVFQRIDQNLAGGKELLDEALFRRAGFYPGFLGDFGYFVYFFILPVL